MVSICIPLYNNRLGLTRLLESIRTQSYKDFEIVITDDSNESSSSFLKTNYSDLNIHYYKNEMKAGATKNTNKSIELATGNYIKIMHHDDYFTDNESLSKFVSLIENNDSDFAFSGSLLDKDNNTDTQIYISDHDLLRIKNNPNILFLKNIIGGPSSTIFKKGYQLDNNLMWLVDIDFYINVFNVSNKVTYTKDPLITAEVSSDQLTYSCLENKKLIEYENIYVFKKYKMIKNNKQRIGLLENIGINSVINISDFSLISKILLLKSFGDLIIIKILRRVSTLAKKLRRRVYKELSPILDIYYLQSNRLTFVPIEGVANRIKHIFTYLHKKNGNVKILNFHWEMSYMVNRRFSELFTFEPYRINEIIYSNMISNEYQITNTWRLEVDSKLLGKGFTKAYPKDDKNKEYIEFEFKRIPEKVRDIYLPYFRSLKPSELVLERIKSVSIPKKSVSVHIRLNKQWIDYNRGSMTDLDYFIESMRKEEIDTSFFLACCDDEVSKIINEAFPGRVYELQNKNLNDNVDDIAELYLLSMTKKIIGSYGSTFSELAWWLGECRQDVEIIGSYEDWKK